MPICTAVLAAALLSGPVSSTPADPAPASKSAMAPGKQIAQIAMKNPDDPELIASKALDVLKGKGTKIGPASGGSKGANDSKGRNDSDDSGAGQPQDVFLTGGNPTNSSGVGPTITKKGAPAKSAGVVPSFGEGGAPSNNSGFGPTINKNNAPAGGNQGSQLKMPPVFGQQFADSFAWPQTKLQPQSKTTAKNKKAKSAESEDNDWMSDWT
ncbi:hypothetical protein [Microbispora corallina]|nr:hypothetical protein [Microbispora corallina]